MTMKKVTLNNEKCLQICLKKQSAPKITQKELTAWREQELGAKVDQPTISQRIRSFRKSYDLLVAAT